MRSASSLVFALFVLVNAIYTQVVGANDQAFNSSTPGRVYGGTQRACGKLLLRREWRAMTNSEKANYITAVKCLQARPARDPALKAAKTRFDEFQAYHITEADKVHIMGQFLPWHRQYVRSYELALQNECGYKGATPYWDWSLDSDSLSSLSNAPVFDPITGFGGNGVPGTYTLPPNIPADHRVDPQGFDGCVRDGPFANYTLHCGPGKLTTDHCLTRHVRPTARNYLNSTAVANIMKLPTFELFRVELEGQPVTNGFRVHDGGHWGIGGEMGNFYSSPGDPLFYLHHANLDRIWWNWQRMLPSRLYEISGRSTLVPPLHNVTLDFTLHMGSLGSTVPIGEVMDIHSEPNCYTYV
ncbi:tyrosinase [Flammula alnicola]|nr:tyrosinase [Flammula alnicola]